MGDLLNESGIGSLVNEIWNRYSSIERWIHLIYKDSQIYRLAERVFDMIKVYFKYSFFGRITEIPERENPALVENSKVVAWGINRWMVWKDRFTSYSNTSEVTNSAREIKKEFYLTPLKIGGIVAVSAIVVNISLSVLLNRELGLGGWFVHLALLFVGLGGIFCDAEWNEVEKTSFVLRKIWKFSN